MPLRLLRYYRQWIAIASEIYPQKFFVYASRFNQIIDMATSRDNLRSPMNAYGDWEPKVANFGWARFVLQFSQDHQLAVRICISKKGREGLTIEYSPFGSAFTGLTAPASCLRLGRRCPQFRLSIE